MDYKQVSDIFSFQNKQLSEKEFLLLEKYEQLLKSKNEQVNLISRKDILNIWENHILHSLTIHFLGDIPNHSLILDLGTGGGLPGIPLAISLPNCKLILLDSIQKKITTVRTIVRELSLSNIQIFCERAESFGENQLFAHKFDFIVTRAVTELRELIKWSSLLLKKNGVLYALKGGDITNEIFQARKIQTVKSLNSIDLKLQGLEYLEKAEKKLVIVRFI